MCFYRALGASLLAPLRALTCVLRWVVGSFLLPSLFPSSDEHRTHHSQEQKRTPVSRRGTGLGWGDSSLMGTRLGL